MPHATTDAGVRLYYEETGSGRPVIFVHEYAGDSRRWDHIARHASASPATGSPKVHEREQHAVIDAAVGGA